MKWSWLAAVLLLSGLVAQERPEFEAASVHVNSSSPGGFSFNLNAAGGLAARNMTVWNLAREAYGWRDNQIVGGPGWIQSAGFDIQATAPAGATSADRARGLLMLQTLLADRFHFRWHQEMREMPSYALRVAPNGPKLLPARVGGTDRMQRGNLNVPSLTLESLCQILEFDVGRPVIDQTGLKGSYAIELQWAREISGGTPEPDTSKPSLFTAVQEQLGLRLESAKLPVKVFVIDDVQKPGEN